MLKARCSQFTARCATLRGERPRARWRCSDRRGTMAMILSRFQDQGLFLLTVKLQSSVSGSSVPAVGGHLSTCTSVWDSGGMHRYHVIYRISTSTVLILSTKAFSQHVFLQQVVTVTSFAAVQHKCNKIVIYTHIQLVSVS